MQEKKIAVKKDPINNNNKNSPYNFLTTDNNHKEQILNKSKQ